MADEETIQELSRKAQDLADHFKGSPPGLFPTTSLEEEQYDKAFDYVDKIFELIPNHGGALEIFKELHYARFLSYIVNYRDYKHNPDCIDEDLIQAMHDIAMPLIDKYIDASLTLAEHPTDFPYQALDLRENVFIYNDTLIENPYQLFLHYLENKQLSKNKLEIFYKMLKLKKWKEVFPETGSKDYVLSEGDNLIANFQERIEISNRENAESQIADQSGDIPFFNAILKTKWVSKSVKKSKGWVSLKGKTFKIPYQPYKALRYLAEIAQSAKEPQDALVQIEELAKEVLVIKYDDGDIGLSRDPESTGIESVISDLRREFNKNKLPGKKIIYGGKKDDFYWLNLDPNNINILDPKNKK